MQIGKRFDILRITRTVKQPVHHHDNATACVFVCALCARINVTQGESWRNDNLCCTDTLMLSRNQERRFTVLILLLFSTHLLLLLSVLGKCLSFSEYLCILWHGTEVKLCRALWSCNAVDMGRTPVCRWGSVGLSSSLLNY